MITINDPILEKRLLEEAEKEGVSVETCLMRYLGMENNEKSLFLYSVTLDNVPASVKDEYNKAKSGKTTFIKYT